MTSVPDQDAGDRLASAGRALVPRRPRPGRIARVSRWWPALSVIVLFAFVARPRHSPSLPPSARMAA